MEKWREVYTEEQIKKIQELEFKNLCELERVCKEIGVEFFAYGGTLLGAVRHNGFIPWDDDLDVAMVRTDYEKFVREAPKHLSEEFHLQTPYTDSKTPFSYTKLRLKGTTYIEYINRNLDIEKGVYVDIYPIDNLPDSDSDYYKQYKAFHRLAVLYAWRQSPGLDESGHSIKLIVKRMVKGCVSAVLKLVPQKCFVRAMDTAATRYNNTETSRKGNLYYPKPVNIFEKLYPLKDHPFGELSIKIPDCAEQHLASRYGDYMSMPPEEKRIGHKPYKLDFGKY